MIVLGADTHKRSHTIAAVDAATGELFGDKTVQVGPNGFGAIVEWARALGGERAWALEDCRHVSGALERFLIARGERVVRVSTRLSAEARRSGRQRGKSDRIDAAAVARAALREGLNTLPAAQLAGVELEIRLLVDHRERLVRQRAALSNDARWHLHDLWPDLELPLGALLAAKWTTRIARRLARAEQTARVRVARDELRRIRELTQGIKALETEIEDLVAQVAPQLLDEPGCGPLTAAKLVGEIAGAERFASDAKLARAAGLAPIPVSSGRTDRHRLDRGGNRQINAAMHRMAVTRARCHPETRAYIERKRAEGKTDPSPQAPPRAPHLAAPQDARRHEQDLDRDQVLDIGATEAEAPCMAGSGAWSGAAGISPPLQRHRDSRAEAALRRDGARELQLLVEEQRPQMGFADHVTADRLIEGWEWLVDEVEAGYDDIVEEYANDLSTRDILDRLLAVASPALARTLRNWVEALDRRFFAATTEASEPFHGAADPTSPYAASRWHWRVPKKLVGALAEDFAWMLN